MKFLLFITICTLLQYIEAACYNDVNPVQCSTCGGSCTTDNGCSCRDYTDCVPAGSECSVGDNSCCDMNRGWYWDSELSCCTDVIHCNPPCKSDEICDTTTSNANCVCNSTTYKGITTDDLKPIVSCEGGTMITSISRCQLEYLGYNYNSFHVIEDSSSCTFSYLETINNVHVQSMQVKAAVGWCGNIDSKDSSQIYFTNTLYINPNSGPLITKNPITYNFTCIYNLNMQTSLNFSLNPVISSITIPQGSNGIGTFTVTMAAYKDKPCSTGIQQGETVLVGSDVYLGVFSPDADGDVFALTVENCLATPTNNRDDPNHVQLLSGGCAIDGDVQTTVIQNGKSLEDIIQISSFQFQGFNEVYIFCDVRLCNKTGGCDVCSSGRSGEPVFPGLGINLQLQDNFIDSSSGHHTAASWAVLAGSLLAFLTIKLF